MATSSPRRAPGVLGPGRFGGRFGAIGIGALATAAVAAVVVAALSARPSSDSTAAAASPTASTNVHASAAAATPDAPDPATPQVTTSVAGPAQDPCDGCAAYPSSSSPVAGFDDGLRTADLPPLVERPGPNYPEAHRLTAAVWDKVGPGWGVATYWMNWNLGVPAHGAVPAELYLVSPEGVHFHVMRLADGLTYGAFVESVDLSARTAVISMNGEGGYWMDDVDLARGTILEERDFVEEGGGREYAPYVIGPFVHGIEIRVRPSFTARSEDDVDLWNPATGLTPIELPPEDADAGGSGFTSGLIPLTDQRSVLWVRETDWRALAEQGYTDVRIFDVVENTFRPARALYPSGYDTCEWPVFVLNNTSVIDCERGTYSDPDWAVTGFTVTFDGTTPAAPSPLLSRPYQRGVPWRTAGFDVSGDGYGVSSVTDVAAGARVIVYQNPWGDEQEGSGLGVPFLVGDGLFTFVGRDIPVEGGYPQAPLRVIGYNRYSGDAFNLVPGWLADTGAPSALSAYVAFGE